MVDVPNVQVSWTQAPDGPDQSPLVAVWENGVRNGYATWDEMMTDLVVRGAVSSGDHIVLVEVA